MKKKRIYYLLMFLFGLAGIGGLTAWNIYQVNHAAQASNQLWVDHVSELVTSERESLTRWISRFPIQSATFRDIAESRPGVAALFMVDQRTHETSRWLSPSLHDNLEPLDPRLGALQLKVLADQQTMTGPIVFVKRKPYFTVARPLGSSRVLFVFVGATRLWQNLKEESTLWHLRTAMYDYEQHLLFSSEELPVNPSEVDQTLRLVRTGTHQGRVPLESRARNWFASFHYDPASDMTFVVMRRAHWVYAPVFFFVISILGVLLIVRIPFRAAEGLHREAIAADLANFASRVDNFIRGRDVMLHEPPPAYKQLTPIVHVVRWLVPQWKKAELFPVELALERKLLALLVESLPEGILFFNEKGALQLSNELGRVFLTLQQEGREARMVMGVQVPRGFLEPFLEPVFTASQANLGKEVEVSWADGKHLYRIWVERVDTDAGKSMGFIVVVRDITFRKQWEYVQEQVLSGITHDLRGPLSAVMGYLDLIRRQLGESGPPKVVEYVKLAREGGLRLSQMVSDILDVVRFEQGKIDMNHEAIQVAEVFERLKNTFGVIAEQKKVNLKVAVDSSAGLRAWGDRKLLERVFDNLVGNAIKFTPAGGDITVTAEPKPDRIIFRVADTGRGIPREAQSRIFDKFQQVRPGDRSSGYGLGLAVAKFIVEAHKGEIRVESEVGQGSCFTIWIPIAPKDAGAASSSSSPVDQFEPNSINLQPPAA